MDVTLSGGEDSVSVWSSLEGDIQQVAHRYNLKVLSIEMKKN